MPRIVSGADEFNPDAALLRGTAIGREWGQARDARAEEERKTMQALLEFHKEAARVKKSEADALEKYAQGKRDAQALATHAAFLERQKENPRFRALVERKGLVEKSLKGMAARGVSEDTIQRVIQHVKASEDSLRKEEEGQQFEEYLKGLEGHAAVPPEDVEAARQQSMMGGNKAQIVKGIEEKKHKAAAEQAFVQQNSIGAQRAARLYESMPPGTLQHAQVGALMAAWEHDPARQKRSGEGEKLYRDALAVAGGKTDTEYQNFKKARAKAVLEQPALGLGGATVGQMRQDIGETTTTLPDWAAEVADYFPGVSPGENTFGGPDLGKEPLGPDYKGYAAGLRSQLEQRYPGRVGGKPGPGTGYSWDFQSGGSASPGAVSDMPQQPITGQQMVANAQAAGLDITDPEVLAQILATIEGGGGAPPGR